MIYQTQVNDREFVSPFPCVTAYPDYQKCKENRGNGKKKGSHFGVFLREDLLPELLFHSRVSRPRSPLRRAPGARLTQHRELTLSLSKGICSLPGGFPHTPSSLAYSRNLGF